MGLKRIPRENIFSEFVPFMFTRRFEEADEENLFDSHTEEKLRRNKNLELKPKNSIHQDFDDDDEFGHSEPRIKRKSQNNNSTNLKIPRHQNGKRCKYCEN